MALRTEHQSYEYRLRNALVRVKREVLVDTDLESLEEFRESN